MPDSLLKRRIHDRDGAAPLEAPAPTAATPESSTVGSPVGTTGVSPIPDPDTVVQPSAASSSSVPAAPAPEPVVSSGNEPVATPSIVAGPLTDAGDSPRVLLSDAESPSVPAAPSAPAQNTQAMPATAPSVEDSPRTAEAPPTTSSRLRRLSAAAPEVDQDGSPLVDVADNASYAAFAAFEQDIQKSLSVHPDMAELTKNKRDPQSQRRAREIIKGYVDANGNLPPGMTTKSVVDAIFYNVMGYGPIQPLLDDPDVDEIMINSITDFWVEKQGRLQPVPGIRFRNWEQAKQIADRMLSPLGRQIDETHPMANGRLPDGSRVNVVLGPVALRDFSMTIRKFREQMTPEKLLSYGSITQWALDFIHACVTARLNVLISGGTGAGKTASLNAFSSFIPHDQRVITIEDAAELSLPIPNIVPLETKENNVEGKGAITIRDLVRNALRMRPDRIVVGECRGGEALDMLQAMNTGHDGSLTTVHANSPADSIKRLNTLVLMAGEDLPHRAINEQIASAINLIVQVSRMQDGTRKITAITEVVGMGKKKFADRVWTRDLFQFVQTGVSEDGVIQGELVATGKVPNFLPRLSQYGFNFPETFFAKSPLLPDIHAVEEEA